MKCFECNKNIDNEDAVIINDIQLRTCEKCYMGGKNELGR